MAKFQVLIKPGKDTEVSTASVATFLRLERCETLDELIRFDSCSWVTDSI